VVYVRLLAGGSYVRTPRRDPAVVRRVIRDRGPRVGTHAALALAERAGPEELALLWEYLSAEPRSSEVIGALGKTPQQ